jgi:hypothetical protein
MASKVCFILAAIVFALALFGVTLANPVLLGLFLIALGLAL